MDKIFFPVNLHERWSVLRPIHVLERASLIEYLPAAIEQVKIISDSAFCQYLCQS